MNRTYIGAGLLKLLSVDQRKTLNAHFRASGGVAAVAPTHDRTAPVRRILVIDDDHDIRELRADVLIAEHVRQVPPASQWGINE